MHSTGPRVPVPLTLLIDDFARTNGVGDFGEVANVGIWALCHEALSALLATERNYTGDEGRSSEFDNQVLVSSHRKLSWSKAWW